MELGISERLQIQSKRLYNIVKLYKQDMKYFNVIINKPKTPILTYQSELDLKEGDIVLTPFRNEKVYGILLSENKEIEAEPKSYKIKNIDSKLASFSISKNFLKFIQQFAKYYMLDLASCCKMLLPVKINEEFIIETAILSPSPPDKIKLPELSEAQNQAYQEISSSPKVSLLNGVTGSGKTEVYFHIMADFLKLNKQILIMLPEIGLTSQIMERFTKIFNFEPVIWHSGISPAKKRKLYRQITKGEAKVIIGTRSSLFLPYKNLSLIIIDEEHDSAYKQEENTLYNARDAAILRASLDNIKIILVSATPSLETHLNCKLGKYHHSILKARFGKAKMPSINIIDMKMQAKGRWISKPLQNAIEISIKNGLQSLLFINRRGYAPLILCASCGYRASCKNCSSWLVVHKKKNLLICHHCGYSEKLTNICSDCSSENLISCGPGVERIAEEAEKLFPESRIQIFTKEEASSKEAIKEIVSKIENSEIDILIGTQIITKGYHFPKISIVGIIDADLGSANIDLKANERCFQVMQQVSGRSGRDEFEGSVYIQTYFPDSKILEILSQNLIEDFYESELKTREQNFLPPFSRIIAIIISGNNEFETLSFSKSVLRFAPHSEAVRLLGPAPATMSKLRGAYRFRILAISNKTFNLQSYIDALLCKLDSIKHNHNIRIEVDPYSFY